VLVTV
jgi:hypothetical protein